MHLRTPVIAILAALAFTTTIFIDERNTVASARGEWPAGTCQFSNWVSDRNPPPAVMAGEVDIDGHPRIITPRGGVNWRYDPTNHPSVRLNLFSLKWFERLVTEGMKPNGGKLLERASLIAKDFVTNNLGEAGPVHPDVWEQHATGLRTSALLCLRAAIGGQPWLDQALRVHAAHLAEDYAGQWNHGTVQDIALLVTGCQLEHADARNLAVKRLTSAIDVQVDEQGVSNEQAVDYQGYLWRLWRTAYTAMQECAIVPPRVIAERIRLMPAFLENATQPNGLIVPLGDSHSVPPDIRTPVTRYLTSGGREGKPGRGKSATYARGFVFGRTGWGTSGRLLKDEHFMSLRFGPGRIIHGHNDHMSLTYYGNGRDLIVDGGHDGYRPDAYRDYLRSPAAHNVVEIVGVRHRWNAPTRLTRKTLGPRHQFYETTDRAYGGISRTRGVLLVEDPGFLVVYDRGHDQQARTWRAMWHLAPDFTPRRTSHSYVSALSSDGTSQLLISQVPLPGQSVPSGSTRVVRGAKDPYQGWVSPIEGQRLPASTVMMQRRGKELRMLTLIVPAAAHQSVSSSSTKDSDGWYRVTVRIGFYEHTIRVSPDGYMTRADALSCCKTK
ncbi:heparinase II/III family protein [Streptomyces sp. PSKA30]|uniref:heparinase II/III domain-containing protein n=1 Tax=Streptomyces sp. PSKA30 TaxID=2874597 RepID=UPI001CD0599E|nr:heparinase II/III family protein [Streptomyces sp. PSKA30]MBZ9639904.1 heparinase II/III-family protein [Streptomyces sp. PSKA30]